MGLIFVTGGAKSGKSKFAEEMLLKLNNGKQKNVYLATSIVFDEEMKEKVRLHKERRENNWITVETYKNFEISLNHFFKNNNETQHNMLVDCLTNMVTNIIFEERDIDWDNFDKNLYVQIVENLKDINDAGNGVLGGRKIIVDFYDDKNDAKEAVNIANKIVAEKADEVYFVVSGIPMKIK